MPSAASRAQAWLLAARPRADRFDAAVVLAFAALVLLRWPDRARYLLSWDADTFAIALEDYNVRGLHPHAPGYPLYVALGRVAHVVLRDANDAYIAVGLACTAAAIGLAYHLGRRMRDRATGLTVACALAAAPLVYVHSVTANVYAADLACSLAVAAAAWHAHERPGRRGALILAIAFAVAVGIRPSILLFLAPLVAWGIATPPWTLREQARRLWPAAAAGAAIGLAWFLPMAAESGGIAGWREANRLQGSQVVLGTTAWEGGWPTVQDNLARLGLYVQWELRWLVPALALLVALAMAARLARRQAPALQQADNRTRDAATFLALWGLPATAFYLLVFSGWNEGPSGYALVALPAYLLAGALVGRWALHWVPGPRGLGVAVAVVALGVPLWGLASHAHDVRDVQYKEHDAWVAAWNHLPQSFPASNSSIVASYQFAHVWYSFPEYTSYNYRPPAQGPGETPDFLLIQEARDRRATPDWYDSIAERRTYGPHELKPGVDNLVLFDFALAGENGGTRVVRDDVPVREAWLPNGWRVLYLQVTPDRPHLEDYFTMDGALP